MRAAAGFSSTSPSWPAFACASRSQCSHHRPMARAQLIQLSQRPRPGEHHTHLGGGTIAGGGRRACGGGSSRTLGARGGLGLRHGCGQLGLKLLLILIAVPIINAGGARRSVFALLLPVSCGRQRAAPKARPILSTARRDVHWESQAAGFGQVGAAPARCEPSSSSSLNANREVCGPPEPATARTPTPAPATAVPKPLGPALGGRCRSGDAWGCCSIAAAAGGAFVSAGGNLESARRLAAAELKQA